MYFILIYKSRDNVFFFRAADIIPTQKITDKLLCEMNELVTHIALRNLLITLNELNLGCGNCE